LSEKCLINPKFLSLEKQVLDNSLILPGIYISRIFISRNKSDLLYRS
jgi:hypothetical protein